MLPEPITTFFHSITNPNWDGMKDENRPQFAAFPMLQILGQQNNHVIISKQQAEIEFQNDEFIMLKIK